ncbi:hypothetical protein [Mycolicibacterium peregrinum]|nr:hypothetical protein [Mycolicibacterium peregrinum]
MAVVPATNYWLLSSDVGTSHTDRQHDETWVKTSIYPETAAEEINALMD